MVTSCHCISISICSKSPISIKYIVRYVPQICYDNIRYLLPSSYFYECSDYIINLLGCSPFPLA
nr:MAG TPA: hypothetical protein [Caudoviricetes sp.]